MLMLPDLMSLCFETIVFKIICAYKFPCREGELDALHISGMPLNYSDF